MTAERSALVGRLQQQLLKDATAAGWPYYRGKSSRVEPTCWTLLALGASWPAAHGAWSDFARPHLQWLFSRQAPDGLITDTEPALANMTAHALALLVANTFPALAPSKNVDAAHSALVRTKGVRIDVVDPKQDNQLQGWPWVQETFSWIEPTAWALLTLKRLESKPRSRSVAARCDEAERLLLNRTCVEGGWNYGNASALGQDLRAYVPTTAIGLLAMQDRRTDASVQRSLRFLVDQRLSERTSTALSLTAICLRLFGAPADDVEERLAEVVSRSEATGAMQAIAMAAYVLSHEEHRLEAFRV